MFGRGGCEQNPPLNQVVKSGPRWPGSSKIKCRSKPAATNRQQENYQVRSSELTREDQFKLEEFKKFKIAVHESSITHKEDSYDQMLFKDLVRRFLLQQRNQVTLESSETDSRVIHSPDPLQDRNLQLRERLQFLQPRERVVQIIMEYLIFQDYLNLSSPEEGSQESSRLQSSRST